jgi:hypothetical protein
VKHVGSPCGEQWLREKNMSERTTRHDVDAFIGKQVRRIKARLYPALRSQQRCDLLGERPDVLLLRRWSKKR